MAEATFVHGELPRATALDITGSTALGGHWRVGRRGSAAPRNVPKFRDRLVKNHDIHAIHFA